MNVEIHRAAPNSWWVDETFIDGDKDIKAAFDAANIRGPHHDAVVAIEAFQAWRQSLRPSLRVRVSAYCEAVLPEWNGDHHEHHAS